jgi:hypothetical protein
VAVQEVRRDKGGGEPTNDYTFFNVNGNVNHYLEAGFSLRKGTASATERVEFISDRMSYITLRGRWCNTVLNVHAPTEDKGNDTGSFYEELERAFHQFPMYHIKMLL